MKLFSERTKLNEKFEQARKNNIPKELEDVLHSYDAYLEKNPQDKALKLTRAKILSQLKQHSPQAKESETREIHQRK